MTEVAKNEDILWGGKQIAEYLGREHFSVLRLLKKGTLPARRVGRFYVSTKPEIDAALRATAPKD